VIAQRAIVVFPFRLPLAVQLSDAAFDALQSSAESLCGALHEVSEIFNLHFRCKRVFEPIEALRVGVNFGNNSRDIASQSFYFATETVYVAIESVDFVTESAYFATESAYFATEAAYFAIEAVYFALEAVYFALKPVDFALEAVYFATESVYFVTEVVYFLLDPFEPFLHFRVPAARHCIVVLSPELRANAVPRGIGRVPERSCECCAGTSHILRTGEAARFQKSRCSETSQVGIRGAGSRAAVMRAPTAPVAACSSSGHCISRDGLVRRGFPLNTNVGHQRLESRRLPNRLEKWIERGEKWIVQHASCN
jgi:hypothetical protein